MTSQGIQVSHSRALKRMMHQTRKEKEMALALLNLEYNYCWGKPRIYYSFIHSYF